MKKVIVTGANGFIGRNLIKTLLKENIKIIAIDIDNANSIFNKNENVIKIQSDMKDVNSLYQMIPKDEYQCFYHFAWNGTTGVKRSNYEIQISNVKLTCEAALLSKKLNCKKFISTGTITEKVAENSLKNNYTAENLIYGLSKLYAHQLIDIICTKNGINYIWAQLSNIYGGDNVNGNLISYTLEKFRSNEIPEYGPCEQPYDFTSIDDVVNILFILGLQSTKKHEYFLGSGNPRKLKEYIQEIATIFKHDVGIGKKPDDGVRYEMDWFDASDLKEFNYQPKFSFSEAINKIYLDDLAKK